ncbi:MAG: hypothetical protein IPI64_02935 [Chloracidobacterium sp.]|nr:hypothetical protein [Chloracidobacterium sp.]
MKCRIFTRSVMALSFCFLLMSSTGVLAQYKGNPVKKEKLVKVIRMKQLSTREIVAVIKTNGVDFKVTPLIEAELSGAGARPEVVSAAAANYRAPTFQKQPASTPIETTAEDYDLLFDQGYNTLSQMATVTSLDQAAQISRSVIEISNRAIKLDPTRPDAYKLICTNHVLMRNFVEAQSNCQSAVDRGGSIAFPVYHLSGTPHLETLYIGKDSLSIESNQKLFQFIGREVSNLRNENDYDLGTMKVAVFSMQTYKDGRQDIWNYTPGNTGTTQEANMIMQLINRNSIGNR